MKLSRKFKFKKIVLVNVTSGIGKREKGKENFALNFSFYPPKDYLKFIS